jgi:hypothetical protein
MKKNNLIVMAIIGGIILGGLGFYCGLGYANNKVSQIKVESPLAGLFSSKVISGLTVATVGQIKEISGRNLILTAEGSDLTVFVKEDASIDRFLPAKGDSKVPQTMSIEKIKFEDMKVGDNVNIFCNLKTDLSLEGVNVTVSP